MKLRIRGSAIRLRLSKSEVLRIAEAGRVEDAIDFGAAQRLSYALVAGDVATPSAHFSGAEIVVTIPRAQLRAWAIEETVGIEAEQDLGNGQTLSILVEKDFACLKPREGEEDGDAFPNPSDDS